MQRTTLLDNLNSEMFLKSIFSVLKTEKEKEIRENAKNSKMSSDELNAYSKKVIPIETVLNSNTEYKDCFLYQKIQNDLTNYIQNFHKTQS